MWNRAVARLERALADLKSLPETLKTNAKQKHAVPMARV